MRKQKCGCIISRAVVGVPKALCVGCTNNYSPAEMRKKSKEIYSRYIIDF
jgi:hypothetical protein